MPNLSNIGVDLNKIASNAGVNSTKAYLNALYPNEFEYYMLTLELVKNGQLEDILIFPVTPDSFSETTQHLVNVKKTNNSIISLINTSFAPRTIQISGTFGRKLRILFDQKDRLASDSGSAFAFSKKIKINKGIRVDAALNVQLKTGFGITKQLEKIINKSYSDAGYMLFLYNPMLGNNYLVECTDKTFSQSMQNNMLWNYQLTFKAIAPAELVSIYRQSDKNKRSLTDSLKYDVINKGVFEAKKRLGSDISTIKNELLNKIGLLD